MLTVRKTLGWNWREKEAAAKKRAELKKKIVGRRCAPNEVHPYRYFDGEKIVSFNTHYPMPLLAGSSLNRKNGKGKKISEVSKAKQTALFEEMAQQSDAAQLCSVETELPADSGNVAGSKKLSAYRVRLLSAKSKDKIRGKTRAFFAVKGKASTFVTLTFISKVSDRQGISMLNKFLTQLRKDHGNFDYIWVAERQTNNKKFPDNIHFHLIIDRRLSLVRYNSLWLFQQYNAGLKGWSNKLYRYLDIEEVRLMHEETMLWVRRYRLAKHWGDEILQYIEAKIHEVKCGRFLNPFNIKKINNVDALSGYLTKYVTKNKGQFACATWRCSRGVSSLFTKRLVSLELWGQAGSAEINYAVNKDTGELYEARTVAPAHGFCLIRYILNKKYFSQYTKLIDKVNEWILKRDFIPDIERLSLDEYVSRIHNAVGWS